MTETDARIAVVIEDDADIREVIEAILIEAGFAVKVAGTGAEGIKLVRAFDPILTTLDVNMPGMDGFETLKRLRLLSERSIIMISARIDEIDVVRGLSAGADDFVAKPFRTGELRARIDAVLRRTAAAAPTPVAPPAAAPAGTGAAGTAPTAPGSAGPGAAANAPHAPGSIAAAPHAPGSAAPGSTGTGSAAVAPHAPGSAADAPHTPGSAGTASTAAAQDAYGSAGTGAASIGPAPTTASARSAQARSAPDAWVEHDGLRVNSARRVVEVEGKPVPLTRSEFDLLANLVQPGNRVHTKAELVLELHGDSYVTSSLVTDADKRSLEVHVANVRKKIGRTNAGAHRIETVRGVGYRLGAAAP
jgi:DNA-binding response OmpR family regulator